MSSSLQALDCPQAENDVSEIEFQLLLQAIYAVTGLDFQKYAPAFVKRRLEEYRDKNHLASFSMIQHALFSKPSIKQDLIDILTIKATDWFRDPQLYHELKSQIFPYLATFPSLKIWHAGSSTGEEVYSLAILLQEAELYSRTTIYATDINPLAIECARRGEFSALKFQSILKNYQLAGGKSDLLRYFRFDGDHYQIDPSLQENITFLEHNLAQDHIFGEFHLILCRNVLIYFQECLQQKALDLFLGSLRYRGILCLGSKENLSTLKSSKNFSKIHMGLKIFRKNVYSVPVMLTVPGPVERFGRS